MTDHAAAGPGRTVILVEGASDREAVLTLAARLGRDLHAEEVSVVAMGGASNIGRHLDLYAPLGVELAGLCDQGEAHWFQSALVERGLAGEEGLDGSGFFVCVVDLEDELIRALGPDSVMSVIASRGQLNSFRRFQRQPFHRDEDIHTQLWSWMSNWKIRYATLLVDALDLELMPAPLEGLLGRVLR